MLFTSISLSTKLYNQKTLGMVLKLCRLFMNITLDFSPNKVLANMSLEQPLAIMSAELAKKLLKLYARHLSNTSTTKIIEDHASNLLTYAAANDLQGAMEVSTSWLAERELIQNITHENWDAYTVSSRDELGAIHVADVAEVPYRNR